MDGTLDQLLATPRADAAGKAFATGLSGREGEEVGEEFGQGKVLGNGDDAGVTEQKTRRGEGLEVEGQAIRLGEGDQTPQGAADLEGLDGVAGAAAQAIQDLAQGGAHRHLVNPGAVEAAVQGDQLGAGTTCQALGRVGLATGRQDIRQIGQGLDVAEEGGFAEQAMAGGEGRPDPDLGPQALDGVQQGGLLPADVGPRARDDLKAKGGPGAAPPVPREVKGIQFADGRPDGRERLGILTADVEDAGIGADDSADGHHAGQDRMGSLFQQPLVGVGPRVALVGIADDILLVTHGLAGGLDLEMEGEAGAPPSTQPGRLDLAQGGCGRSLQGEQRGVISRERREGGEEDARRGQGAGGDRYGGGRRGARPVQ